MTSRKTQITTTETDLSAMPTGTYSILAGLGTSKKGPYDVKLVKSGEMKDIYDSSWRKENRNRKIDDLLDGEDEQL